MKINPNEEKNMFQKYDDLFAEQDKKYDKKNSDRYAKKKDMSSEGVDYQQYVSKNDVPVEDQDFFNKKQTEQSKNNKNNISTVVGIFILIGGLAAFTDVFLAQTPSSWFVIFIAISIVLSIIKKRKKN